MNIPVINLNSGELSPKIDARSDIEKFAAGCRVLENMIPLVYGPVERRPGFQYIYGTYDNDVVGRVIPFIYSNAVAYVIEMTEGIFRFYYDGGIVLDDDDEVVTTETPYTEDDLFQIQYAQSNDVMWLTHGDYAPRLLRRTSPSVFELDEIDFKYGPFLGRNDYINNDDITLSSSVIVKDAVGTLTAAGPMAPVEVFEAGHVDSLWKMTLPRVNTSTSGTAVATGVIGAAIDVDGPFTLKTAGHWGATLELQRNEDENGWETYRTWISTWSAATSTGSLNAQYTGVEYAQNVQYRIYVSAYVGGTVDATLTVNTSTQTGIVKVQSVTNSYTATCKVISKLASVNATKQWYEGAWSGVRGYPKTMTIFQNKAIYATTTYQPQTIWLSQSGYYSRID